MKSSVRVAAALALLLAACTPSSQQRPPAQIPEAAAGASTGQPPNVIWILLDACRAEDLSCYGYNRATSPRMDALARRGTLFENHFTNGLWTILSVPGFMTGRYFPVSCLQLIGADSPREIPAGERLLPEVLKQNGYATLCVTAQAFISPRSRLYKAHDESALVMAADGTPKATFEELNKVLFDRVPRLQSPFFIYIHALDTHVPYRIPPAQYQWSRPGYASDQFQDGQPTHRSDCQLSEADRAQFRGMYDDSIHYADACIGELLDFLDQGKLGQNTVVLVTADHGDALAEDGIHWGHEVTYDQVLHIPLILAGPGVPAGKRVRQFTEHVDLVPTLVDLLGLKTDLACDGKSVMPLLRNETGVPWRDCTFTRFVTQGYEGPAACVLRTPEYKYIYDFAAGTEELWRVPDNVADRTSLLAANPAVTAALHERVLKEYLPLWQAYDKLPKRYIDVMLTKDLIAQCVEPKDATVIGDGETPTADQCTDNKWLLLKDKLWAASWSEKPTPLTMHLRVPPGRYTTFSLLYGARSILDHPASSIRLKAGSDAQFKDLKWEGDPAKAEEVLFQELGTYDLKDGVLDVTIEPGDPAYWAVIERFRFIKAEDQALSPELEAQQRQREDQLRALGYTH